MFQSGWAICGIYCRGLKSLAVERLGGQSRILELKRWEKALIGVSQWVKHLRPLVWFPVREGQVGGMEEATVGCFSPTSMFLSLPSPLSKINERLGGGSGQKAQLVSASSLYTKGAGSNPGQGT